MIGRVKELLARRRPAADGVTGASAPPRACRQWAPARRTAPGGRARATPAPCRSTPISIGSTRRSRMSLRRPRPRRPPTPAPAAAPPADRRDRLVRCGEDRAPRHQPDLELPAPPAMDERPDLPLTAFAATVPELEAAVPRAGYRTGDRTAHRRRSRKRRTCRSPRQRHRLRPSPQRLHLRRCQAAADAPAVAADAVRGAARAPQLADQMPALADAFAALLAAEHGEVVPRGPRRCRRAGRRERVLAQLSERVVRETVADVVSMPSPSGWSGKRSTGSSLRSSSRDQIEFVNW